MVSLPRMRVVCGLVSVALNSALHESPSTYSAYLHACTDKISRAQPAPKSERRCHNRIFLKYLFQLKGLEPSFGFEQVKHAVPIERSTESGIDRCFFIRCTFFFTLSVYLKRTNLWSRLKDSFESLNEDIYGNFNRSRIYYPLKRS